jgi:hypothetical protein
MWHVWGTAEVHTAFWAGKPEGRRPLGIPKRRWETKLNGYSRNGAWGGVVVKALRYYSDGPGIDSRWCHWIFL